MDSVQLGKVASKKQLFYGAKYVDFLKAPVKAKEEKKWTIKELKQKRFANLSEIINLTSNSEVTEILNKLFKSNLNHLDKRNNRLLTITHVFLF